MDGSQERMYQFGNEIGNNEPGEQPPENHEQQENAQRNNKSPDIQAKQAILPHVNDQRPKLVQWFHGSAF